VRNCSDGSVEAHLEGAEAAVQQMVERFHDGPPHARVDKVDVSEATAEGLTTFDVRH
jgi:acylphosphatase